MPNFTPGNILAFSDFRDILQGDAVELDRATGVVVQSFSMPKAATGDVLTSGVFALAQETLVGTVLEGVGIFSPQAASVALVTSVIPIGGLEWTSSLYALGNTFYFLADDFAAGQRSILYTIDALGVVGAQSWTLPSNADVRPTIAVAPGEDILYYYRPTTFGQTIFRYDLTNSVALSSLLTIGGSETLGVNSFVEAGGDLLVPHRDAALVWTLRRYSPAGALVTSYTLPTSITRPEMCADPDPDIYWVRTFPDSPNTISVFTAIQISTGTVVHQWTVTVLEGGGSVPDTCPFMVARGVLVTSCPPANLDPAPVVGRVGCLPSTPSV